MNKDTINLLKEAINEDNIDYNAINIYDIRDTKYALVCDNNNMMHINLYFHNIYDDNSEDWVRDQDGMFLDIINLIIFNDIMPIYEYKINKEGTTKWKL